MSDIELETGMGFSGVVKSWEVINSDGTIAQSGGGNSNLILDQGLDMPPDHLTRNLLQYCAIGTGTTAPSTSDTGLVNERNRTSNTAGIGNSFTQFDTTNGYEHRKTFEFSKGDLDSSSDGEYGELGFSPNSTSGTNLFARTLIKDDQGNPVTVTVGTDQKFRVTYSLFIKPLPDSQTSGSVNITNIGTVNYTHMMQVPSTLWGTGGGSWPDDDRFTAVSVVNGDNSNANGFLEPYRLLNNSGNEVFAIDNNVYTFASYGSFNNFTNRFENTSTNVNSYVSGNYYIEKEYIWDTSTANVEIITIFADASGNHSHEVDYAIVLDSADRFTKDNLHELTFTYRLSWARA